MVWSKLIQRLNFTTSTMSLFLWSNANKFITHTFFFSNDCSKVDWLSVVKTKLKGHVQVVWDGKDKVTAKDDIFRLDELVDPCWVAPSTNLEENLIFYVAKNIFVVNDADELNNILRTNGYTEVWSIYQQINMFSNFYWKRKIENKYIFYYRTHP
jgi:hypothetical protein